MDAEFCKFIMKKHRLVNLGEFYFKQNFSQEYLVFLEAWSIQQEEIDKLRNTIELLTSSNPVASKLFGKTCARQALKQRD